MSLTFLLGGARSGKSTLAVRLAASTKGPVVFVATAESRDEEMATRIAEHRAARPATWATVEEPIDLGGALSNAPADACLVLDCLTLWVSNLLERGDADEDVVSASEKALAIATGRAGPVIAVSNEVGSGIVPAHPVARRYRDLLGRINAMWADAADEAFLLVAGRALVLQPIDPRADHAGG